MNADCMELLLCASHRAAACGTPAEVWVNSIVCLLSSVPLNKEKGIKSNFVWHRSPGRQLHNTFRCEILLVLCSEYWGYAFGRKGLKMTLCSGTKFVKDFSSFDFRQWLWGCPGWEEKYFCWLLWDWDSTTSERPTAIRKDGCTKPDEPRRLAQFLPIALNHDQCESSCFRHTGQSLHHTVYVFFFFAKQRCEDTLGLQIIDITNLLGSLIMRESMPRQN